MAQIIDHEIKGKEVLSLVTDEDIVLEKGIAELSDVNLISNGGSIVFKKNIDDDAQVLAIAENDITCRGEFNSKSSSKFICRQGSFTLEGTGGRKKNLNSQISLQVIAENNISLHGDFNSQCRVNLESRSGTVSLRGDLNSYSKLTVISEGDIVLNGDINSNVDVNLISTRGGIHILGHINSEAVVCLVAGGNVQIDKEVNGNLSLRIRSGGTVRIGKSIDNHALVEIIGLNGIDIGGKIAGDSKIKLAIAEGSIVINGNVEDGSIVNFWPDSSLTVNGSGISHAFLEPWTRDLGINQNDPITGKWWTNWFLSYGYVSNRIFNPRNREELVKIVRGSGTDTRVKAVGGSWSFSDMTLPLDREETNLVSIFQKGRDRKEDLRYVFRHMESKDFPMDLYPNQVYRSYNHSTSYNQENFRKDTKSGIDLPPIDNHRMLIDTRNLKSSLQHQLKNSRIEHPGGNPTYLFWVEAGITMTELNHLLNHQYPRLAIQASGGSPGATLAGTISTATHGGEFQDPLLVDRIMAIHLVTPGGIEWWIEGDQQVMTETDLHSLYGSQLQIINRESSLPERLTSQDFLKAVVVSCGAIGVIYSVVLEVVEQFSIQQITNKIGNWDDLLQLAGTNSDELIGREEAANRAVFNVLVDGSLNGTNIPLSENRYVDLAINPFNQSCWIVNRRFLDRIVTDSKDSGDLVGNYAASLTKRMTEGAETTDLGGQFSARILDFLSLPRDVPGIAALAIFEPNVFTNFFSGVLKSPMLLSSLMAHIQAKVFFNRVRESDPKRSYGFMRDILEGILDALQGTYEESRSDITGLSFEVGAIGWPDTGIPGRGFEVALPVHAAFTYIQSILNLIDNNANQGITFMGYLSIRICPQTQTVLGMQQFDKTIMVEIVAHRTPQANQLFDSLIDFTKTFNILPGDSATSSDPLFPNFHWGLENERFDSVYLEQTILNQPYRSGLSLSRLEVFRTVKQHLTQGHPLVFDNGFVARMGF